MTSTTARLRILEANIVRYNGLLMTDLAPYERLYVERRIEEERFAIRLLAPNHELAWTEFLREAS